MELDSDLRIWFDTVLAAIAAAEAGPSEAEMMSAPVLDRWRPVITARGHIVLWGMVAGHPLLGENQITTSQLIALDAVAGWARTASRWYRLAQPFTAIEAKLTATLGMNPAGPNTMIFELPGFQTIKDPELIPELLAAYIKRVKEIDAMDRATRAGSDA